MAPKRRARKRKAQAVAASGAASGASSSDAGESTTMGKGPTTPPRVRKSGRAHKPPANSDDEPKDTPATQARPPRRVPLGILRPENAAARNLLSLARNPSSVGSAAKHPPPSARPPQPDSSSDEDEDGAGETGLAVSESSSQCSAAPVQVLFKVVLDYAPAAKKGAAPLQPRQYLVDTHLFEFHDPGKLSCRADLLKILLEEFPEVFEYIISSDIKYEQPVPSGRKQPTVITLGSNIKDALRNPRPTFILRASPQHLPDEKLPPGVPSRRLPAQTPRSPGSGRQLPQEDAAAASGPGATSERESERQAIVTRQELAAEIRDDQDKLGKECTNAQAFVWADRIVNKLNAPYTMCKEMPLAVRNLVPPARVAGSRPAAEIPSAPTMDFNVVNQMLQLQVLQLVQNLTTPSCSQPAPVQSPARQSPPRRRPPPPPPNAVSLAKQPYRVLFDFVASDPDEISIFKGETVQRRLCDTESGGWVRVCRPDNVSGFVPIDYIAEED
eukprot:CAMPEP_0114542578 /NCGR_PEP_ID=MMETSP0114-20121206/1907_1 /TAXON_ID=31324 /ORGANISM="Goniomonas sp, Strain m" /LENGTH=498 /DNA_ID=CAMNT_0001726879 /DNA_START=1886 /DNA_END=3382 /DNA_ORIENTATION=-